ncbi:MAG: tetraacyldisaccharide 4'-kinase [Rhodospirillales bacterium]|nr:tetraacyldisaccharide 4'-kinase [Rhodospirillales bacterium]
MRTPDFWYRANNLQASLLAPLGCLYDAAGRLRRAAARPFQADAPVICVGNLVMGGAGKTPVVQALAGHLRQQGKKPAILLRGYGGLEKGPLQVNAARHKVADVGDEALLHANLAPTWIGADRAASAKAAIAAGADILVLDDGFQNPGLHQDLPILVIDGETGFGNGRVFPAGPLRESVALGLRRAKAVVLIGDDKTGVGASLKGIPLFKARIAPENGIDFKDRPVIAFAGIGRPQKFFSSLESAGARIVMAFPFPDHHAFTDCELEALLEQARDRQAMLVATAKDHVRLPEDIKAKVQVLRVRLRWEEADAPQKLLAALSFNT